MRMSGIYSILTGPVWYVASINMHRRRFLQGYVAAFLLMRFCVSADAAGLAFEGCHCQSELSRQSDMHLVRLCLLNWKIWNVRQMYASEYYKRIRLIAVVAATASYHGMLDNQFSLNQAWSSHLSIVNDLLCYELQKWKNLSTCLLVTDWWIRKLERTKLTLCYFSIV